MYQCIKPCRSTFQRREMPSVSPSQFMPAEPLTKLQFPVPKHDSWHPVLQGFLCSIHFKKYLKTEEKGNILNDSTQQISSAFNLLVTYFLIQESLLLTQLCTDSKHPTAFSCPLLVLVSPKLQFSVPVSLSYTFNREASQCSAHTEIFEHLMDMHG